MSLVVFLGIAIVLGVTLHRCTRTILLPSLLSGIGSSAAFHLIGLIIEGALDSLVMISAIVTFIIAFAIALAIGAMMRHSGRKLGGANRA